MVMRNIFITLSCIITRSLTLSKVLVAYYSFEGTTELIAKTIAEIAQADILSIKPVNELKSKGFSKYFWGGSQVFMKKYLY